MERTNGFDRGAHAGAAAERHRIVEYIRAAAMSRGCRDALNKIAAEIEVGKHDEWAREG